MSYILEALKKAEAERKGGTQPSAPLLPPIASTSRHPPAWRRPLPWAGFASLAIALASAAWFALTRDDASPAQSFPLVSAPVQTAQPAVPAPKTDANGETQAAPAVAERTPAKPKEKAPSKKVAERKRIPPSEDPKTAIAAPPEPAVGTLRDLPEQVQREIPTLSVSGYIYSGNKADRSVLINKRLLREGDEVVPGLLLEKMTPSGMVFNYKGYRYRSNY